ncbi:MAG TPA: outer membrane beta-barrel protein [Gammaproteobacteria bacterium]|nr:outer membrane beta-barrel protein [Gammaproteobacteria bacterium]
MTGQDDNDTTTGFQLGYLFIDSAIMLSGEVGSFDLGSYGKGGTDVDADAVTLAGVLGLAIGLAFEIYAKAGIASSDVKVNGKNEGGNESFSGVGFSIDILDTLDFYAEYLEFNTEVNSDLQGAGISLQF